MYTKHPATAMILRVVSDVRNIVISHTLSIDFKVNAAVYIEIFEIFVKP